MPNFCIFAFLAQRIHYSTFKIHTVLGVISEEPNAFIWRWHAIPECMEIGRITFFVASEIEAADCADAEVACITHIAFLRHTYPSCIYVIQQDFLQFAIKKIGLHCT